VAGSDEVLPTVIRKIPIKLATAEKLEVKIINEKEFLRLLK